MDHIKLFEAYNRDRVHVNIWDDYKQEPEYDRTADTHLYVEESDFPKSMINAIIKQIYGYIKDHIKLDDVTYKIVAREYVYDRNTAKERTERRDRIKIGGLTTENREALLKGLKKSGLEYADATKIDFYSES